MRNEMKYCKSLFCLLLALTMLCGCTAVNEERETTTENENTITVINDGAEEETTTSELSARTTASTTEKNSGTSSETTSEKSSETAENSTAETRTQNEKTSEKITENTIEKTTEKTTEKSSKKTGDKVQDYINSMSLEEKVGQLFVVFPEALSGTDGGAGLNDKDSSNAVTAVTSGVKSTIKKYHIGGVVMFAKNVKTPSQISTFNKDLQSASKVPLFIAVDEEGGRVARLARNSSFSLTKYTSAAAVGAGGSTDKAYSMGKTIGAYLKKYGFNMDFAPVADVNSNPDNPVIGDRSFSSDPAMAAKLSGVCARGLKSQGIIPTFKHFPGHGDTAEDSHKSLAVNNHTLDRLMKDDWLPYLNNDLSGCAVMVGHIALPKVTGNMKSAAVDKEIVTGFLREKIGFDGLVVTDSMKMQGVTDSYDTGTASIMAINAGCDIVLMPQNFVKSYNAVLSAVKDGRISESRLNQSLYRIISTKMNYGIIK